MLDQILNISKSKIPRPSVTVENRRRYNFVHLDPDHEPAVDDKNFMSGLSSSLVSDSPLVSLETFRKLGCLRQGFKLMRENMPFN